VLGLDGWVFRTGHVHAAGMFASLVSAAHGRWDLGLMRSIAMLAGVLVAGLAAVLLAAGRLRLRWAVACAAVVLCALLLPGVALQAGLRQSTAPWFYTNDSTYQIEIAGKLLQHGSNLYGHDYASSGLERFYSLDGSVKPGVEKQQVALHHFAYFPGAAIVAAAWGALPKPLSDFRFLVVLCALAMFPAVLLFPGRLGPRLALGVLLAANPLIVHAAWFGTADALSLLLGEVPSAQPRGKPLDRFPLPPQLPAGLPSALLARRPDIRQAVQNIADLQKQQRLAEIAFHTVYLSPPNAPAAVQLQASELLVEMANLSGGTYRAFDATQRIDLFYIDFTSFIRTFALKQLAVVLTK